MTQTRSSIRQRNQAMELFKLIASILVVFIHVKFPDRVGSAVASLARIAVPVFFAISGWFSFGVRSDRLWKRFLHIVKLFVLAVAIAVALGCPVAMANGCLAVDYLWGYVPGTENLARMMLVHESSFPGTGYTWYLIGTAVCYLILTVYVDFFGAEKPDYRPLYLFSAVLLAASFLMTEMSKAMGTGIPYQLQRNGLFLGLPMFTMGLFLREYRERIMQNYRLNDKKLLGIFLLGLAMLLLQWKGIGTGELPPGAVLQAAALMLLMSAHPDLGCPIAAAKLGEISTVVYLIHFPLIGIYETFLLPFVPLSAGIECWLRPIFVVILSILAGILWLLVKNAAKKLKK